MEEVKKKVQKIPALKQSIENNELSNERKQRVAAYCRVSTNEDEQISSYELQIEYYTQFIEKNSSWKFAGVYADYAKSGTSTEKRVEFLRMIKDCKRGKIDLIITKSISRFARNTLDCLNYVRELQALVPPVGIYFEKEKINTLEPQSELLLTILSSLAQEEARSISENIKWSIRKRYQSGIAKLPTKFLLGYNSDEDGNFIINEEEAKTVRRVFREYMEGKGTKLIAEQLKKENIISARGTVNWGKNSIMHILKNERYCGDLIMQKTYITDFLTHKRKENNGQLAKYYIEDNHPAIIPKEEWNAVQAEIKRRNEIATTKNRKIRQGYSNTSVISNHLFCGHCGQPVTRCSAPLKIGGEVKRISVWRCRATNAKSRKNGKLKRCYAKRQQDLKIKEAFLETLIELKKNSYLINLTEGNESLIKILDSLEDNLEFKDEYFRELVDKGVVYDEGKIEYTFKNGFTCTSYIKKNDNRDSIKNKSIINESE